MYKCPQITPEVQRSREVQRSLGNIHHTTLHNSLNYFAEFPWLLFNRPVLTTLEHRHPTIRILFCRFINIAQRNKRILISNHINNRHFQILQFPQIARLRPIFICCAPLEVEHRLSGHVSGTGLHYFIDQRVRDQILIPDQSV